MKIPVVKTKDFLNITDLSKEEIISIFKLAERLKNDLKSGKSNEYLSGRTLAMIFEKRSTRTRVSFETGVTQLGGHAIFLSKDEIQLARGEGIADTAKVLSRYVDCIMIRTYAHEIAVELARNSSIPVINGLTDSYHPCQAMADFFTVYERNKSLNGIKLVYVGDGNNMANTLLLGAAMLGIDVSIACPREYFPDRKIVETAFHLSSASGSNINVTSNIDMAVENANFIYTDVWVSMGYEKEAKKKKKALSRYKISSRLLNKCAGDCLVMHCLPAHRGEEIDSDVMDSGRSIIFDQAENRLHVQKALLCALVRK